MVRSAVMFTKNSPCFLKIFYYVPLITILQRFGSLLHVFNYNLLFIILITLILQ